MLRNRARSSRFQKWKQCLPIQYFKIPIVKIYSSTAVFKPPIPEFSVIMAQYVPWYFKRSCPIFCWPCVPIYTGIWPGRKFLLILGAVLFSIGVMMLLGLLLICIAVECSAVASPLLIFAFLLIVLGILFFHCGWAAHLLDYGGKVPEEWVVLPKAFTEPV